MSRTLSESLIIEGIKALRETSRDKISLRSMSPTRTLNLSTMLSGPDNSGIGSRLGAGGPGGAIKIRNKPVQKIFDRFKGKIKDRIQYAKDRGITPTYKRVRDDVGGHVEVKYPRHTGIGDIQVGGQGSRADVYSYDILNVFKRK